MTEAGATMAARERRAPRWLLVALFASMALNLVIVGLLAGAIWRFRAAPAERFIPVYGSLSSTWPIGSGVLVEKGVVYAANITSDRATGIGAYTDEDILRAITRGVGKSGRMLYAMPWPYYGGMTDDDRRALVLALRAVPPVSNIVPDRTFQGPAGR